MPSHQPSLLFLDCLTGILVSDCCSFHAPRKWPWLLCADLWWSISLSFTMMSELDEHPMCHNCSFSPLIQWVVLSTGAEVFLHMSMWYSCWVFCVFFFKLKYCRYYLFQAHKFMHTTVYCIGLLQRRMQSAWVSFIFSTAGWCVSPFPFLPHCMSLNLSWVIFLMWKLINILGTDCLHCLDIFWSNQML